MVAALLAGLAALTGLAGSALAFDPNATADEALRQGYVAYKNGDTQHALEGFGFAAEKGHVAALWKLGQMYATGDGVVADDRKAFQLFSKIVDQAGDVEPQSSDSRFVARAIVAIGNYHATGIDNTVAANPVRARKFFHYAASYFGDPEAQFRLAQLHLNGQGGKKSPLLAARWFKLAANKGHVGAQAMLGRLMLEGSGVRRSTVDGLMWLSIARQGGQSNAAIKSLHEEAFAAASEAERTRASALAQNWLGKKNRPRF